MKNIVLLFVITILASSCSRKTSSSYVDKIQAYQQEKVEKYKDNEQLKLNDDEINDYFPIDEDYNCICDFERAEKPYEAVPFPTSSGQRRQYIIFGKAKCNIKGNKYELTIYAPMRNIFGKDYLFLPITDLTSGETSYGGGRYLELYKSDVEGDKIHLDFNKLYNPYCAFRDGFSCPVPPRENHIDMEIRAGEMYK